MDQLTAPRPPTYGYLWRIYLLLAFPFSLISAFVVGLQVHYGQQSSPYNFSLWQDWHGVLAAALIHVAGCGWFGLAYASDHLQVHTPTTVRILPFALMFYAVTVGASFLMFVVGFYVWLSLLGLFFTIVLVIFLAPYQLLVGMWLGWRLKHDHS